MAGAVKKNQDPSIGIQALNVTYLDLNILAVQMFLGYCTNNWGKKKKQFPSRFDCPYIFLFYLNNPALAAFVTTISMSQEHGAYRSAVCSQLIFKLDLIKSMPANISFQFDQGRVNLSDWPEEQELSMASVFRN